MGKQVDQLLAEGYLTRSVVPEVLRTRHRQTVINLNRNGKRLLATGTPVMDANGAIWRVVCNIRDISELDDLRHALERTAQLVSHYESELQRYREQQGTHAAGIIGRDPAMRRVIDMAISASATDSTVLVTGESGVGKELIADLIHHRSLRRQAPMIKVNCAAVPEALMESEFFGYDRGAFTGALQTGKAGFFELAHGGTLFLDEVAELPLAMQSKLLRVLQDKCVLRLGGTGPRQVDVRVVAATNRDLGELVRQGRFREDLYYRLHVLPVHVPPLRERPEDIPVLVTHFLEQFTRRHGRERTISPAAMEALQNYSWPGNVRELQNVMERLVILAARPEVAVADLPRPLQEAGPGAPSRPRGGTLKAALAAYEAQLLRLAVAEHGSVRAAARALGVPHPTLLRRLAKLQPPPVQI